MYKIKSFLKLFINGYALITFSVGTCVRSVYTISINIQIPHGRRASIRSVHSLDTQRSVGGGSAPFERRTSEPNKSLFDLDIIWQLLRVNIL